MVEVTLASENMTAVIAKISGTGLEFGPYIPIPAFRAAIQKGRILVATEERVIFGFCWFVPKEDDLWQLQKIVVAPPARGKKVGRSLVVTLIEEAESVGAGIRLKVAINNHIAIALYQSLDFEITSVEGKEPHLIYIMERKPNG